MTTATIFWGVLGGTFGNFLLQELWWETRKWIHRSRAHHNWLKDLEDFEDDLV